MRNQRVRMRELTLSLSDMNLEITFTFTYNKIYKNNFIKRNRGNVLYINTCTINAINVSKNMYDYHNKIHEVYLEHSDYFIITYFQIISLVDIRGAMITNLFN